MKERKKEQKIRKKRKNNPKSEVERTKLRPERKKEEKCVRLDLKSKERERERNNRYLKDGKEERKGDKSKK